MNKATELLRETFGNVVIRYTKDYEHYVVLRHHLDTDEIIVLLIDTDKSVTDKVVNYQLRTLSRS